MKTKIFSLLTLSIFAIVLVAGFASAVTLAEWNFEDSNLIVDTGAGTLTISDSRTATYPTGNAPSVVAAMSTTGWNVADRYIELSINTSGYQDMILKMDYQASATGPTAFQLQYSSDGIIFTNFGSTITIPSAFTANPMSTINFSSITTIDNNANAKFRIAVPTAGIGSESGGTFRIDNLLVEGVVVPTTQIPDEITSCTITGDPNSNLEIRKIKFSNEGISGKNFGKDDEWYPLNDIIVTIEVKNRGEEKIEDVELNWGLWDEDTNEWAIEPVDEDKFNIKKDNTETLTFTLNLERDLDIDLDELDDSDNYLFYVFTTGYDNEIEEDICASDSESINVVIETDLVVLGNLEYPEKVSCGDELKITGDVWNIGDSDQDDVMVLISNSDLGISEKINFSSIDAFDNDKIDVSLEIPANVKEGMYYIELRVYDEDGEIYESDDDESKFLIPIKVEGSCITTEKPVVVSASLVSGGKAGQELIVKASLTKIQSGLATYEIKADGYSEWATLTSIEPSTVIMDGGQSKEVVLTFKVNSDASGEKLFNIQLLSDSKVIVEQPASVTIEEQGIPGLSGILGNVISGGDNLYLWGIGAINVILVVVIIFVALRVARKSS